MKLLVRRVMTAYLFMWARLVLRARRPFIVGVTGSVGKSTTKEVIAAALMHPEAAMHVGAVVKTPGNLNTTMGVPLVVLGLGSSYGTASRFQILLWLALLPLRALRLATFAEYPRVLVLEYAAAPDCDIRRTAALAPPRIAIVTAIGPAHLDHYGSIEGVADAKGELVRQVAPDGLVILGRDSVVAASLASQARARVVTVAGRGRPLSEDIARVVCRELGVSEDVTELALLERPNIASRLQVQQLGSFTVIDDSYNANPLSMRLGLDTLSEQSSNSSRKVAVLGQMNELGAESRRYHAEMGEYARRCSDLVVGVGMLAKSYEPDHWFSTSEDCGDALSGILQAGDTILFKGSHSVGLERIVARLRANLNP